MGGREGQLCGSVVTWYEFQVRATSRRSHRGKLMSAPRYIVVIQGVIRFEF